jgi:hypothetical protein
MNNKNGIRIERSGKAGLARAWVVIATSPFSIYYAGCFPVDGIIAPVWLYGKSGNVSLISLETWYYTYIKRGFLP